ncbi:MAG: hypothetical protein P8126_07180 [Gammaproteobacteria bacterium]
MIRHTKPLLDHIQVCGAYIPDFIAALFHNFDPFGTATAGGIVINHHGVIIAGSQADLGRVRGASAAGCEKQLGGNRREYQDVFWQVHHFSVPEQGWHFIYFMDTSQGGGFFDLHQHNVHGIT